MTASRLAVLAAVTSLVAWCAKAVAIWVAGGLDMSPLESPLFLLGLVALVVAFVALGVSMARGRSLAVKVIGGAVGLLIGVALSWLASFLAGAVIPESAGWVQEEAGLWFSALLAVGLTAAWRAKQGTARAAV